MASLVITKSEDINWINNAVNLSENLDEIIVGDTEEVMCLDLSTNRNVKVVYNNIDVLRHRYINEDNSISVILHKID